MASLSKQYLIKLSRYKQHMSSITDPDTKKSYLNQTDSENRRTKQKISDLLLFSSFTKIRLNILENDSGPDFAKLIHTE